jgi:5'(3')-deoxyribonucleotidase
MKTTQTKFYVDMDGVLADFFGDWAKLMNKKHWVDISDPISAIQEIKKVENFWINLPVLPNAKNLLSFIKNIGNSYTILSTPLANDPNSIPQKKAWVKNNLNFFLPNNIILSHDKAKYAINDDGSSNILIDDYGVNIAKWIEAGGIGIKHKDYKLNRSVTNISQFSY